MTPRAGTNIGNYRLISSLSSGGTASLWKARHQLSQKEVAIKILHAEVNVQRVRNEARLQSSVLHPNIVSIYEFIWLGQQPCIVMELVQGMVLSDYIRQRRPNKTDLMHLTEQLLNAIQFLHEKKIVHRDLKPENIMVQHDGIVKLLDFGIAKGWSSPNITKEGMAIGTPEYMAPERFEGEHSVQSDIWSVGLILFEMVSGKGLFPKLRKTNDRNQYFKKSFIDPQLSTISMPWKKVIAKCLKQQPKQRYRAVKDIFADLSLGTNARSSEFARPDFRKYLRPALLVVGLLLLGFFAKNIFLTGHSSECTGTQVDYMLYPETVLLQTSRGEKLTKGNWQLCGLPGTTIQITLSADGYLKKSFRYTFPELNDNLSYVLEKRK